MTIVGTAFVRILPEDAEFATELDASVGEAASAASAEISGALAEGGAAGADAIAGSVSDALATAAAGAGDVGATIGGTLAAGVASGFDGSDVGDQMGSQLQSGISGAGGGGGDAGRSIAKGVGDGAEGGLVAAGTSIGGNFAKKIVEGAAAIGVAKLFSSSIDEAASLQKLTDSVRVIFGQASSEVLQLGKNSATSLGQSNVAVLQAATNYGNLLVSLGFTKQAAADTSTNLIKVATDLASIRNVPVETALNAIQSGLAGMSRPLRQFGIDLTTANLTQEAVRLGLIQTGQTLTDSAKAEAAYSLIMKDSAVSQGNFAKTSADTANQQKILSAEYSNAKAKLGDELLPVENDVLEVSGKLLAMFTALPGPIQVTSLAVVGLVAASKALGALGLGDAVKGLLPGFTAVTEGAEATGAAEAGTGTASAGAVPGVEALTAALLEQAAAMRTVATAGPEAAGGEALSSASGEAAAGNAVAGGFGARASGLVVPADAVEDTAALTVGTEAAGAATIGLGTAFLGVGAVIAGGLAIYSAWASSEKRVADEAKDLSATVVKSGTDVTTALDGAYKRILTTRGGFEDALKDSGIKASDITSIVNVDPAGFDQFRKVFQDQGESILAVGADWDQLKDKVPKAVQPMVQQLINLTAEGKLSEAEVRKIVDGTADLSKETQAAAKALDQLAPKFYAGAVAAGINATTLKQLDTVMDSTASVSARQKALQELELEYPKVAKSLGLIAQADPKQIFDDAGNAETQAAQAANAYETALDKVNQTVSGAEGAAQGLASAKRDLISADADLVTAEQNVKGTGDDAIAAAKSVASALSDLNDARTKQAQVNSIPLAAVPAGKSLADLTPDQQRTLQQQQDDRAAANKAVLDDTGKLTDAQKAQAAEKKKALQDEKDAQASVADKTQAVAQAAITEQLQFLQLGQVLKDQPGAVDKITDSLGELHKKGIISDDEYNAAVFELGVVKQEALDTTNQVAAIGGQTAKPVDMGPVDAPLTATKQLAIDTKKAVDAAVSDTLKNGGSIADALTAGSAADKGSKVPAGDQLLEVLQREIAAGISSSTANSDVRSSSKDVTASINSVDRQISRLLTEQTADPTQAATDSLKTYGTADVDGVIAKLRARATALNQIQGIIKGNGGTNPGPTPGNAGIIGNSLQNAAGLVQLQSAIAGDTTRLAFDNALLRGSQPGSASYRSIQQDIFYTTIDLNNLRHLYDLAQGRNAGGQVVPDSRYVVNESGPGEILMFGNQGQVFAARDALTKALTGDDSGVGQTTSPSGTAGQPLFGEFHVHAPAASPQAMMAEAWRSADEQQYLHGLPAGGR